MKGSVCNLIWGTNPVSACRNWGKPPKKYHGSQQFQQTQIMHVPNINQNRYHFSQCAWYMIFIQMSCNISLICTFYFIITVTSSTHCLVMHKCMKLMVSRAHVDLLHTDTLSPGFLMCRLPWYMANLNHMKKISTFSFTHATWTF
jgi:hypothetical protein